MPGQVLTGWIAGEQPITGQVQDFAVRVFDTVLNGHVQGRFAAQSQAEQRLPVEAEAQAVGGLVRHKAPAIGQSERSDQAWVRLTIVVLC